MKYRKKPVIIEAWRIPLPPRASWVLDVPEWVGVALDFGLFRYAMGSEAAEVYNIRSESTIKAEVGDWLIKGAADELRGEEDLIDLYPCKPDVFEQIYEAVE